MSTPPTQDRMLIDSRFDQVAKVQDVIVEAARGHGFDDSALFAIKLSLEEALTNAIKHGNKMDPHKQVAVEFQVSDDLVRIDITDQGQGFHPESVPDPTLDENLEKPCGRGVMLIHAYMTDAYYNDQGNRLTMIKRRDCPLPKSLPR